MGRLLALALLSVLPPHASAACQSWCNVYTCGSFTSSACGSCTSCSTLEEGKYCASWCSSYTCGSSYCEGCAGACGSPSSCPSNAAAEAQLHRTISVDVIQCNYQLQLAMQAFAEGGAPAMVREMNAQYATSTDVLSRPYAFVHNVTNATCAVMLAHPDKVLVSGNCDPFLVGPSFKLLNENGIPYIRLSAALTQHVLPRSDFYVESDWNSQISANDAGHHKVYRSRTLPAPPAPIIGVDPDPHFLLMCGFDEWNDAVIYPAA